MPHLWGIDVIAVAFKGVHAFMAAAWLLFDFVVFWLHFDIKNPKISVERRLERARIMHGIDTVVGYIFLLMLPTGIVLCYLTGTPLFTTAWLNWKHALYAIIIIDALYLIPISGASLRNLQAIEAGADNVDQLNDEIRGNMDKAMPAVFLVWVLVFVVSVISLLNLKTPEGQEFIFRKTAAEMSEGR